MVRFKNRWLLVEFIPQSKSEQSESRPMFAALSTVDSKQIWAALRDCAIANFGDIGWGSISSSLNVKYFSPVTHLCIIRVARDYHKTAWATVTLLKSLRDQAVIPHVIHVSGSIKHAQLAAIAHNRDVIARLKSRPEHHGESEHLRELVENSVKEIEAMQD